MTFNETQLNKLRRFGYYTYPLSKELKNITNFIFANIDSCYSNINEQEISDTEIDPFLIKSKVGHINLYNFFKDKIVEKFYIKNTSIRCKTISVSPQRSIKVKQHLQLYHNFINECFNKINEKVFQQEFYTIYYIIKYYPLPKYFHNLRIPRMGFHYDTSILSNLISNGEGLVLENQTKLNNDSGVMLTGTAQNLFPHCFHGVNSETINKTRYTIVSFMLKSKPQ